MMNLKLNNFMATKMQLDKKQVAVQVITNHMIIMKKHMIM